MYRHHEHGGWGNPRWGGGWGGPFVGRRVGYSMLGGLGLGGGGGLMGDLLAGGVGYLMGKNSSQNQQQYPPQYQQAAPQYQQTVPQYQPMQGSAGGVQDGRLAQLNLLGQLRASGTLTDAEFQAEKQKILNGY
jgi:Short C-terminal domain